MRNGVRGCVVLCFTVAGCGGTATEPMGLRDSSLPTAQTEAEIQGEADSEAQSETDVSAAPDPVTVPETATDTDAYACKVVEVDAGDDLFPFVSGTRQAYAGVCAEPGETALNQCWYTGSRECDRETEICGDFIGSTDPNTGVHTLTGGQHMLCSYPCISDDQCPAPGSGTARATCMRHPEFNPATDGGSCMLGCANGETCPDGFVCIEPGLGFGQSDGTFWPAPAQCVQFKAMTIRGPSTPE